MSGEDSISIRCPRLAIRLAISESTPDEHWIAMLVNMGFTRCEVDEIKETLSDCALRANGCPDHVAAILADLHSFTWFAMETVPGVACTDRDTQAGTPAADLVFAVAIGQVPKDPEVFVDIGIKAGDSLS